MTGRHRSVLRLAIQAARYRPGLFALSLGLTTVWNGSVIAIGLLLRELFDSLDRGHSAYLALGALAVVESVRTLAVWGGVIRDRCWELMRGLLRFNLLHAQVHSGGSHAGEATSSPGDALSRFRDDVDDFLDFLLTLQLAMAKIVFAGGSIAIIIITLDPLVSIAVVGPLIGVVAVAKLASPQLTRRRTASRRASADVAALLGELFGAITSVKAAAAESTVLGRLRSLNERRRIAALRDQALTTLLGTFNRAVPDLSIGAVLVLAAPAMHRGDFTAGELALVVSYLTSLVWVPIHLGRVLARHRQAEVATERLAQLLPPGAATTLVTPRRLDPQPPNPRRTELLASPLERLTVADLTAVHPTTPRGVHGIELVLERGSFTVITGPAGAGKSTLLRAVLGLIPARSRRLQWNGCDVDDPGGFLVPPRSAYVPQVPQLFSETLRGNVSLGVGDSNEVGQAIHDAVIDVDIDAMPDGLDTHVGARGVRLSGGQVQRAAVARALMSRTELLVLDDVSSALDVDTERTLWNRVLGRGIPAVLAVSNRPATIARADQVIHLELGRVASVRRRLSALPTAAAGS